MSIDIDWERLTAGSDGLELAEFIREFIHDKFQQVALPRFIRSVQVHAFEFGDESPQVEIKDICDPLPDFYENEEDDEEVDEEEAAKDTITTQGREQAGRAPTVGGIGTGEGREPLKARRDTRHLPDLPTYAPSLPGIRTGFLDHSLSRSSTPGLPGVATGLNYFHLPLSGSLSGTQTPLAAVAGGTSYPASWQYLPPRGNGAQQSSPNLDSPYDDPSTRPSTAHSHTRSQSTIDSVGETIALDKPEPEPTDIQVVLHIAYTGHIRLSLTTEILLDYPMTSFIGIPMKLNITGLSFDGVALIAYLKRRAHFCFLGQEDAEMLVGAENKLNEPHDYDQKHGQKLGGLLREIKVESEIGQKDEGKQVLKNVGKVEKFVLDQVRKIFEDEFVYPSFWTFLV